MKLQAIEDLLASFEAKGGNVFKREAEDPEAIHKVAEALGLVFPDSFREFYETYRYLNYGPEELNSVRRLADEYALLRFAFRKMPRKFLPFMDDGGGGHYFICCRSEGKKESSEFGCVYFVGGGRFFDAEYKSSDFVQFLVGRIQMWAEDL